MSSWSSWKVSICQDYHHPELMKENGLGCSYLRTIEFVIWTRHNRAITLVRPVRTILDKTTHITFDIGHGSVSPCIHRISTWQECKDCFHTGTGHCGTGENLKRWKKLQSLVSIPPHFFTYFCLEHFSFVRGEQQSQSGQVSLCFVDGLYTL